jgi:hypothetical protein
MKEEDRSYYMLEELGVQPSIFYQVKVRNVEGNSESHHS